MSLPPDAWDDTDRQIAAVLQVSGRATWGSVARILQQPERTIARRGQRLIDAGIVRVSTYLDTATLFGARSVVIRIQAESHAVRAVARAVAERGDASSVSVLEGTKQIVALLIVADLGALERLVLDELPEIPGVVSCESMSVLRRYRSGYDWVRDGVLEAEVRAEAEAVTRATLDADADLVTELSPHDDELIRLLAGDGRMQATRLAEQLEAKTGTVRRRVEQLISSGTLRVRAEVQPKLFGLRIEAMVWLRVPPGIVDAVGRALADRGDVRFCAAVTGEYQLMVDVLAADEHELLAFCDDAMRGFPGVALGETGLVLVPVRRGPLTLSG